MKSIKKSKKASAFDMVITFSFSAIMVIVGGLCIFIFSAFNEAWQENTVVNQVSKDAAEEYDVLFTSVMDGAVVFYFVILWIISLVTARYIDTTPVFFVIFIILSVISFIGIGALGMFQEALEDSALSVAFDQMPMSSFIIEQSIWFGAVFALTVGASLYFKLKEQGSF